MSPPPLPDTLWLWLAIAGLGLFHGINPAMGWLFAVALGLNRRSERVVWFALLPIGLGHALAVAVILILVLAFGLILEPGMLRPLIAAILFAWAGCTRSMGGAIRCASACRSVLGACLFGRS
ncbi:MAG: hypothetical protein WBO12_21090 [Xanthobacteraceae bacterium]